VLEGEWYYYHNQKYLGVTPFTHDECEWILNTVLGDSTTTGCQSGETSIGQDGCSSGETCCCSQFSIKKSIVAYGGVPTSFVDHLSNFDLIDADAQYSISWETIKQVKQKNPNVIVLGYFDFIGSDGSVGDDSWYILDANGNRVKNKDWGWYLMNPASPGWRNYVLQKCSEIINKGYDGIFADDVWGDLYMDVFTPTPAGGDTYWNTGSPYTRWQTALRELLSYVKSKTGNKLLIYNSLSNVYLDVSDGKMIENFVFNIIPGYREESWYIEDLYTVSSMGKYVLASPHDLPSDTKENFIYGLASYLLGANGPNTYFSWKNIWSSSKGIILNLMQ
jgi:hypothetical protein